MILRTLFLLPALALALSAQAEVQVTSVTGASNTSKEGVFTLFGGTAGAECSAYSESIYNTCSSCEGLTSWQACNNQRIYDSLVLTIEYTASIDGVAEVLDENYNAFPLQNTPVFLKAGDTHRVEILWSDICTQVEGVVSCENINLNTSMSVGVRWSDESSNDSRVEVENQVVYVVVNNPDPALTGAVDTIDSCQTKEVTPGGICYFSMEPRDKAARLRNLHHTSGFPYLDNVSVTHFRFYLSEDSAIGFPESPFFATRIVEKKLSTDDQGQLVILDPVIRELINGKRYFARISTVDEAMNISRITSDSALIDACGSMKQPHGNCPMAVVPRPGAAE